MEKKICQSCAMPMTPQQYGTNTGGAPNDEYCEYCFQNGAFTSDSSLEEMIETCVPFMEGMTEEQARKMLLELLPQLKRWKVSQA